MTTFAIEDKRTKRAHTRQTMEILKRNQKNFRNRCTSLFSAHDRLRVKCTFIHQRWLCDWMFGFFCFFVFPFVCVDSWPISLLAIVITYVRSRMCVCASCATVVSVCRLCLCWNPIYAIEHAITKRIKHQLHTWTHNAINKTREKLVLRRWKFSTHWPSSR